MKINKIISSISLILSIIAVATHKVDYGILFLVYAVIFNQYTIIENQEKE